MDNLTNILMQFLSSGGNPQQIAENLIKQNPQLNAVLNQARNSGMSMRDFTMQYAKQNGINLQPMLDLMAKRGYRP